MAADAKYGDPDFNRRMRELGLRRLFLHAASLSFPHPDSGELLTLRAPLDFELRAVLERIGLGALADV